MHYSSLFAFLAPTVTLLDTEGTKPRRSLTQRPITKWLTVLRLRLKKGNMQMFKVN